IVTAPVPRFRLFVPVKAKSPPQVCALLAARVMAPPLVLFSVPPLSVRVPLPSALALLIFSVPPLTVRPPPALLLLPLSVSVPALTDVRPSYVLLPAKASVPAPVLVSVNELPPIAPPTVSVLASTSTIRLAVSVTAPVPRFSAFDPRNEKSPPQ